MKSRVNYVYSHRVRILLQIVDSVVPCPEYTLDFKQNYEVNFAYILYFLVSSFFILPQYHFSFCLL